MGNKKTLLERLSEYQAKKKPLKVKLGQKWQQVKPLFPAGQWFAEKGSTSRMRHLGETQVTRRELKILTYNIQAGLNSSAFKDYLASGLKQFLPSPPNLPHIEAIGDVLSNYDIIALQELDGGSHRSGHLNQLVHLAEHGAFEFWHQQLNRNLGRFGQYSNGVLSRFHPFGVEDHRLPGLAGRGAIICRYGPPSCQLVVCCVHLALSEKARHKQLEYLAQQLLTAEHLIIMGDMNCLLHELDQTPLAALKLKSAHQPLFSFPSWQPTRNIDHILVSKGIEVIEAQVLNTPLSDHLPVSMRIELPAAFQDHVHEKS